MLLLFLLTHTIFKKFPLVAGYCKITTLCVEKVHLPWKLCTPSEILLYIWPSSNLSDYLLYLPYLMKLHNSPFQTSPTTTSLLHLLMSTLLLILPLLAVLGSEDLQPFLHRESLHSREGYSQKTDWTQPSTIPARHPEVKEMESSWREVETPCWQLQPFW